MAVSCKLITLVVIATGLAYQFSGFLHSESLPNQVRAAAKIPAGVWGAPSVHQELPMNYFSEDI